MAECSDKVVSNNVNFQLETELAGRTESPQQTKTDKAMEPLLIEDCTEDVMPKSIENMLTYLQTQKNSVTKEDLAAVLIYILMLESGFIPLSHNREDCEEIFYDFHYTRVLQLTKTLPQNWRKMRSYEFQFVLQKLPLYLCKIRCISMSDDLVINCTITGVENATYSILVDPHYHITNSKAPFVPYHFQNLRRLSFRFKTEISYPVKTKILYTNNVQHACLSDMPSEVIMFIIEYLDRRAIKHLALTSVYFNSCCVSSKKWKKELVAVRKIS